ncbi:hypothetical protein [Bacteroides heparinolyticus]|uniref:Uncharacterized protein n=2 Tax=Prevotella heparinolytica TaxID=28113 RepID=A0A3P2A916_9BACE|nr:hypothetical protein [Bacteroides heparinolyticus]RRD91949.1 hypothetical protein EII33_05920 [Bacteroides heparinolyticus]
MEQYIIDRIIDYIKSELEPATDAEHHLVEELPTENVREVEKRIALINEKYMSGKTKEHAIECIVGLKFQRWRLMRDQFEWTDENIARIAAMNEKLKEALLDMRRQTIEVYELLKHWHRRDKELSVTGTLWVDKMSFDGWEQDEEVRDNLEDILKSDIGLSIYKNGVQEMHLSSKPYHMDTPETYPSEHQFLYLSDELDNWDLNMDREKSAHLNLVYAVHNLYDHCDWALQDLLNIESYDTEIKIEYLNKYEPDTN